ncbi:36510_t:CDS:2 [Racocetra persica]|uniref:36510_t:CDS:1 n=1 Tax=Racocetra persica TaxID=160502 RepID=A0ACA9LBX4_9GLOM|nr:36510_t:CDS:2 [Racocetra persica]
MVTRLHDIFYNTKATLLSKADIKEIRESRDYKERLQQGVTSSQSVLEENFQIYKKKQIPEAVPEEVSTPLLSTEIPKKNSQKGKVKIDEKLITKATSMVKKNNKNNMASSSDNSSDTSREDRLESLLENLVKHGEKLKSLTVDTSDISSI